MITEVKKIWVATESPPSAVRKHTPQSSGLIVLVIVLQINAVHGFAYDLQDVFIVKLLLRGIARGLLISQSHL